MADLAKQTFSIDDVTPQISGGGVLLIFLAVIAGVVAGLLILPNWLPGLSQSILAAKPKIFWFLSRGSAFVSFFLLWFSMILGIGVTNKLTARWPGLAKANDLHQYMSILGLFFGLFHGLILLGDQYSNFSLSQILLPFATTTYRPLAVGLGQIGFYLWGIVIISFYIRKKIGTKVWRMIHFASYLTFAGALIHGILSGTDASAVWVQWMYWGTGGLLLFFTVYRILAAWANAMEKKERVLAARNQASNSE